MISRSDVLLTLMHIYGEVHPNDPVDMPLVNDIADAVMGLIQAAIVARDEDDGDD